MLGMITNHVILSRHDVMSSPLCYVTITLAGHTHACTKKQSRTFPPITFYLRRYYLQEVKGGGGGGGGGYKSVCSNGWEVCMKCNILLWVVLLRPVPCGMAPVEVIPHAAVGECCMTHQLINICIYMAMNSIATQPKTTQTMSLLKQLLLLCLWLCSNRNHIRIFNLKLWESLPKVNEPALLQIPVHCKLNCTWYHFRFRLPYNSV